MPLVAENHGHIWHRCAGEHDRHCMFCDGGICCCTRCKAAEGTLTTECPGIEVSNEHQQLVFEGTLDFANGKWYQRGYKARNARLDQEALVDGVVELLNTTNE